MVQQQETNEAIIQKLHSRFVTYSTEVRCELSAIIQDLERENTSKTIWEEFEHRFIAVNPEFYQTLLQSFPDLTQNEKRLCAFLKLNMNTKEISTITGQTPHSINVARTRLRKKLGLSNSEVCTCDFLSAL
jgi:DNA-binding CsgD family transcriptional regulator